MVCLGNICRSPIAEGVLRHKAKLNGLEWIVDSAGTESFHLGEPPHRLSQKICIENGIDISDQKARRFIVADLNKYDKIYALADDVYDEIRRIARTNEGMHKVDLFLNELTPGANRSVPDLWYGPEEGYRKVFELINQTCDAIIKKYKIV
jgi:protein-tyrosine phosphatase